MKEFHDSTRSELDFEQLPPALRRKFFSSLERLRLAQDGVHRPETTHDFPRPFTSYTSLPPASRFTHRSSHNLDCRPLRPSTSTRNRLRKPLRPQTQACSVTPEDVAHFASLPAAVRRKYFSREDQVLLASRINTVILDAADEAVYKRSQWMRTQSHHCLQRLQSSHTEEHLGSRYYLDEYTDDMGLAMEDMESFQWLNESDNLDLSLYDYHAAVTETAVKDKASVPPSPSRRSLSISNISFNKHNSFKKSSSARNSMSPSIRPPVAITSPISTSHKNKPSITSLDPGATHYRDPAARMKLRVYLASPQKFDEAIEFGFPSLHDQTNSVMHTRPKTTARMNDDPPRTFFNDDTPSLSDGEDGDVEDVDSPRTPSASAFSHGPSHDSSLDRSTFRPRLTREVGDLYVHAPSSNREMTLHMTLTRPDLRSPDDLSVPKNINSLPLDQPSLEFADNSAFWDSLPDEESKVKKLLKKFRWR